MTYTLTTQQVEDGFAHEPEYEYSNPIGYGEHVQSNRRAFRRWLAEYTAEVRAQALEDAADAMNIDPVFRDPLRLRADWLRARVEKERQSGNPTAPTE